MRDSWGVGKKVMAQVNRLSPSKQKQFKKAMDQHSKFEREMRPLWREMDQARQEMACDAFHKRYPKIGKKRLDAIARWLERNAKRIDKLMSKGWDYSDVLDLAYSVTRPLPEKRAIRAWLKKPIKEMYKGLVV